MNVVPPECVTSVAAIDISNRGAMFTALAFPLRLLPHTPLMIDD